MNDAHPVQSLLARLQAARLAAVDELAISGEMPTFEGMERLSIIQTALTAVAEEIELHRVKLGGGSEQELK
jgi:hypothetical protein